MTQLPDETFPHVVKQMTVESPAPGCVCADEITHPLGRLDDDGVLVWRELTAAIFQLTPKSVQMNRMLHHRVVDQHEAYTLTEFQMDWLSLRKLIAVEAPNEPLHVAGEVKNDFASRRSTVHTFVERAEIGICQHATTISIQAISRIVRPWSGLHCNTDHLRANMQRHLSFPRFGWARHD